MNLDNHIQCKKCGAYLLQEDLKDHLAHTGKFAPKVFRWSKGKEIKQGCAGNKDLINTLNRIN